MGNDGKKLDDWAGIDSKICGYETGEYGEAMKRQCLGIIREGRKVRKSVGELQRKIEDMELRQTESERTLECPVCLNPLRSPVQMFQCVSGHIVCGNCKPKIQACPKCRERMMGRAHDFENF